MRICLSLVVALVFGILGTISPRSAFAAAEKPQAAVVFVSKIKKAELFESLSYPARVTPRVNTTLLAETDGVVSKIAAPLGQRVSAGQTILTITHTDPIYQYAPAKVTSPVSGIVSVLEVTEGTQVTKGQKIAAVTDPALVRISVEVPASDIASLHRGLRGEFSIPGRQENYPVRIHGISPFVDPATGTAACEIEFDGTRKNIVPGLIGQVAFKANVRHGISIPDSAINYKGAEAYVRIVDQDKAKKVPVRLGIRQKGYVEVLEGLRENMQLVERASKFIADGDPVVVQTSDSKPGVTTQ